MADSATTRIKLRKQSLGSNVNSWGDTKLNDALDTVDRAAKGYQSIAVTGDATWTWANYTKTNEGQVSYVKLTGSLSSSATITVPATEWLWSIHNAAGNAVQIKTASGSGITLQNGDIGLLACDATNVVNVAPTIFPTGNITVAGKIDNLTAGTAGTDATNLTQVNALIASGSIPGADGTVKMDAAAASKYLNAAILVGGDLTKTDNGDTMTLSVTTTPFDEGKVVFLSQVFG